LQSGYNQVWLAVKGCCMPLVCMLLHVLKSYAALYSMFLLCILLRSIRSMFSRCMTVYVYLHGKDKIDAWLFSELIPSLCSKLYWQFLFHKLLHTIAFCLMVNSNSLIVWMQVWCINYASLIRVTLNLSCENSVHVGNNCTPVYFVFRSVYSSSSSC